MKTFGMLFIILGHIMPVGYKYIYVFSVPLFFVISGFLGHAEADHKTFWNKSWRNLILPCIIICLIVYPFEALFTWRAGTFEWVQIPKHFFNCIIGKQGYKMPEGGLGVCWFIYTLFLCKLLQQITSKSRAVDIVVICGCIAIAIWYNMSDLHLHNAVVNTTLAYPFYAVGGGYKCMRDTQNNIPLWIAVILFFTGAIVVIIVGEFNGAPWMYDNTYGRNIILFVIGGLMGTFSVFGISYLLKDFHNRFVDIIAKGTIVILGFHTLFIRVYEHIPTVMRNTFTDYCAGFIILVLFIPFIQMVEKYFPVLLGTRIVKK